MSATSEWSEYANEVNVRYQPQWVTAERILLGVERWLLCQCLTKKDQGDREALGIVSHKLRALRRKHPIHVHIQDSFDLEYGYQPKAPGATAFARPQVTASKESQTSPYPSLAGERVMVQGRTAQGRQALTA